MFQYWTNRQCSQKSYSLVSSSRPISARFPNINHGNSLVQVTAETAIKLIEKGNCKLNNKFKFISETLGGGSDFVRTINNYKKLLGLNNNHDFNTADCELICRDTGGYRQSSIDRSPVGLSEKDVRDIIFNSLMNNK